MDDLPEPEPPLQVSTASYSCPCNERPAREFWPAVVWMIRSLTYTRATHSPLSIRRFSPSSTLASGLDG